ncbi:monovalent cation/H+ antiporter subunit D [Rubellimicrobium aerolatum]|uniref:Monovalent cation/H+ antiporter subunit D n=1 Tax=Rubellimicrobium aerolatum TaxID=490979 RepID=A0ABW0SAE6_9RHOB|nr:monovalent cation/H+ antiporter subunit D [Rubellimicrobium aerolatum]MBP1805233.1 multicomponent K+:H+ antiporter subunit D [Rubellimicrobium aerolatum]
MTSAADHLLVAPILIPFFAGALMLLLGGDRRRGTRTALGLASALALLAVAVALLGRAARGEPGTYLLGDWPAPFGILLVHDRLSAAMLALVAVLAIPALIQAAAGWQRQGQFFQPLFQFLLMGLNGAFLTGDLFNLFVFFEVLLAASYGLLLHGSGLPRVRAGLRYIAVNLTASLMFLIGISLVYGVTGTLNMAHLSRLVPGLAEADRLLLHLGAAFLALAFLVKAGAWPLSFWLPAAYAAAAPPVAAMFAILTKVGVYAVLRLSTLLFGTGAGASAGFGSEVLAMGGLATIGMGALGVLGSRTLAHMAGNLVLVSSGTSLAVTGFALAGAGGGVLAGGLHYLVASTLACSALFLLVGPLGRDQDGVAVAPLPTSDDDPTDTEDEAAEPQGPPMPGALAALGLCFAGSALVLAGLPPLPGFLGKLAILSALLDAEGLRLPPSLAWAFMILLLLSGLAALIGLMRVGIRVFWTSEEPPPRAWLLEVGPVAGLLAVLVLLTMGAEPVQRHMQATAAALLAMPQQTEEILLAPRAEDQP